MSGKVRLSDLNLIYPKRLCLVESEEFVKLIKINLVALVCIDLRHQVRLLRIISDLLDCRFERRLYVFANTEFLMASLRACRLQIWKLWGISACETILVNLFYSKGSKRRHGLFVVAWRPYWIEAVCLRVIAILGLALTLRVWNQTAVFDGHAGNGWALLFMFLLPLDLIRLVHDLRKQLIILHCLLIEIFFGWGWILAIGFLFRLG